MKRYPFHVILFALSPIAFLYTRNIFETRLGAIIVPSIAMICISAIGWWLLSIVIKNRQKAGLAMSLLILLCFSYGHVVFALLGQHLFGFNIGQPKYILGVLGLIFIIGLLSIIKMRQGYEALTYLANISALSLIMISVTTGIYRISFQTRTGLATSLPEIKSIVPENPPDIYYIIVDGYGRADILEEVYNHDNSEFTEFLRQKGFFVADKSRSNYCRTSFSLPSSLNMTHLDDMARTMGPRSNDRSALLRMIRHNRVMNILKSIGYKTVSFASGIESTEITNVDHYMSGLWGLSEFENILLITTPFPKVLGKLFSQYDAHRKRLSYTLENLPKTPDDGSPRFVFAHLMAPHPPFVFDENGNELKNPRSFSFADGSHFCEAGGTREEYQRNYPRYMKWLNRELRKTINALLADPADQPVIILQGDHGPGSEVVWSDVETSNVAERISILNAYYLPGRECDGLYDGITPVNSFRIIFNCYFETDFELLEDKSFFSLWDTPFDLIDVTKQLSDDKDI